MDKDFYFGIALGMIGGALITANSIKVRKTVKEGQEQMVNALNSMGEKQKKSKNISLTE